MEQLLTKLLSNALHCVLAFYKHKLEQLHHFYFVLVSLFLVLIIFYSYSVTYQSSWITSAFIESLDKIIFPVKRAPRILFILVAVTYVLSFALAQYYMWNHLLIECIVFSSMNFLYRLLKNLKLYDFFILNSSELVLRVLHPSAVANLILQFRKIFS